jgi:hypothetical protein
MARHPSKQSLASSNRPSPLRIQPLQHNWSYNKQNSASERLSHEGRHLQFSSRALRKSKRYAWLSAWDKCMRPRRWWDTWFRSNLWLPKNSVIMRSESEMRPRERKITPSRYTISARRCGSGGSGRRVLPSWATSLCHLAFQSWMQIVKSPLCCCNEAALSHSPRIGSRYTEERWATLFSDLIGLGSIWSSSVDSSYMDLDWAFWLVDWSGSWLIWLLELQIYT